LGGLEGESVLEEEVEKVWFLRVDEVAYEKKETET
jgi:hypothetical protein